VHGGHEPALVSERLVQHLSHRAEAIGRARGVANEPAILGDNLVVDAHHDRRVELVLGRSAQNHSFGTSIDVPLEKGAFGRAISVSKPSPSGSTYLNKPDAF
jgi:hypothetical protein